LCGYGETKPFECVGTFEEMNFAITKTITQITEQQIELPYLLQYYKDHFPPADLSNDYTKHYNSDHNLPPEFEKILKQELNR